MRWRRRARARAALQSSDALVEPDVDRPGHDVLGPFVCQEGQQFRAGEAGIEADPQPDAREGRAQFGKQPPQQAADAPGRRAGAGAQDGGHEILAWFAVEGQGGDQRQVAPRVVVPVEEGELLLAVGGVVGGVHLDGDQPRPTVEPDAMEVDHGIGQGNAEAVEVGARHGILEPRERGLRAQGGASHGIAAEQELLHRIVGEPRRVVAIGVAAGQAEHPLPDQIQDRVLDFAGLPGIGQAPGQAGRQAQLFVDALHQDGPAVRAGVRLIEARNDRPGNMVEPEGRLGYTVCGHRASSGTGIETLRHRFYSTVEGLGGCSLSPFVNNPG